MEKQRKPHVVKRSCLFCGNITTTRRDELTHMVTHTMEKIYFCKICPAEEQTEYQLRRHITVAHNKPKFSCVFCDRQFLGLQVFKNHIISHTNEKWFECRNCFKQYGTFLEFAKHQKTCQNGKFQCETCSAKFCNLLKLHTHRHLRHPVQVFYL